MSSDGEKAPQMEARVPLLRPLKAAFRARAAALCPPNHPPPTPLHPAPWLMSSVRHYTLTAPPAEPNRHFIVRLKWPHPSQRS